MNTKDIKEEISFAGLMLRWGILAVIVVGILFGFIRLMSLGGYSYFAPKVEQIRYNTFKESQSYNEGMIRDLEDIKMQYMQATPDQKIALRDIAIHRFSVYPIDRLPPDLQQSYLTISTQQ